MGDETRTVPPADYTACYPGIPPVFVGGGGPKTADGVDFVLGMPLVTVTALGGDSGRVIETGPDTHEVISFHLPDGYGRTEETYTICLRGGRTHHDLRLFYSSEAARRAGAVRRLERRRAEIQAEIDVLTGKSASYSVLNSIP